jgi:hypothetical protein
VAAFALSLASLKGRLEGYPAVPAHTAGFMLRNAGGLYTDEALGGETQVGTLPPG